MSVLARKIEQQGIIKGKAEGIIEGKRETARVMLKEGVDLNFISKVTGLSLNEITQIK